MAKRNIFNLCASNRCIKRIIKHKDKKFEVYLLKDSPAKVIGSGEIIVTDLFFDRFNHQEQISILYHEFYHKKWWLTKLSYLINLIIFKSFKQARWQEEFDADTYAAENTNKKIVISQLKKGKLSYKEGLVAYNSKTHPPISQRIKNIERL